MAKPTLTDLLAGIEGWDAIVNDNMAVLRDGPLPVMSYANFAGLPAAASYDQCVAHTDDDDRYWVSNGAYWVPLFGGSPFGAHGLIKTNEASSGALSGASYTFSSLFPANVVRIGVSYRVTTLITGATTFDVGDGTDVDRYGAGIALAANTTGDMTDATADPSSGGWGASAGDVVLTANGSNFSGGVVRACAHYMDVTAPQA